MQYYLQKMAMQVGDDELMINYEWPRDFDCKKISCYIHDLNWSFFQHDLVSDH